MANRLNFKIMKIKMFITSYLPLYGILLLLQIKRYPITLNPNKLDIPATVFAAILIALSVISIECTFDLFRTRGNETEQFEHFGKPGDTIISYMMTYIVPLLSTNFLSYEGFIINGILFVLIGIMYIKLDLIYLNPLWLLFGYSMYTTEADAIIISNIEYGKLKQNQNISLNVSYLVRDVYLIRKKDNNFI